VRGTWIFCVPCLDTRDGFDAVFTKLLQWSVILTLCVGSIQCDLNVDHSDSHPITKASPRAVPHIRKRGMESTVLLQSLLRRE